MGALSVGLWMWLLEPGGYRHQWQSKVSQEVVEGAHLSKAEATDSPNMVPTQPTMEDFSEDKVSHAPSTASTAESSPLNAGTSPLHQRPDSSPWSYNSGGAQWLGQRLQVEAWALLPGTENICRRLT